MQVTKVLRDMLIADEGVREKPYLDCCGKFWRECSCKSKGTLTIGVGTNLDEGLTKGENLMLLERRIDRTKKECFAAFRWFGRLDEPRQVVVMNMVFNLGLPRFKGFVNTIEALESGQYRIAAQEMLRSAWAREVGARAERLAKIMETGTCRT